MGSQVCEQIQKLVELQKIDGEIYELKRKLKEKPAYLEQLKEDFESKKTGLQEAEVKYKQMQVDRQSKELELQSKDDDFAKANVQLSQIKTNKEYTAKITEIENIKADKSIVEELILMSYDEADAVKADIDKERQVLADEEKKYLDTKKEIEVSISEMEDSIKTLDAQRSQIVPGVDKATLSQYEKILANKDGLAIVPVQGQSCGGCFMNVPAQVVNEIKMNDHIIYCEMCSRILYLMVANA